MNRFLHIPVRIQLIIIVLIVALPAAGIIVYSGSQFRKSSEAHARIDTQALADVVASEQRLFTASAQQLLVTLSELPQLSRKQAEETSRFLARVHRVHPNYINIFVADSSGAIWASATPMTSAVNISDRRYFKNAVTSGRFSSGDFQVGKISKQPTLHFGYPFWDAEVGRVGVIGLGVPLQTFQRLYDIAKIPSGGSLVLLDHKGIVLFDSSDKAKSGKAFDLEVLRWMQEGPDAGTSTAEAAGDKRGGARYVSYRKLYLDNESTPYLYIWVGIPVESALAEANRQILKTVLAFSAVLAAALLVAWFIADRSIAARISALQQAAEKLAQGDLEARIPESLQGGELGGLAGAFNAMACQLTLREQLLLQREAELKKAQQLALLGSWTYDIISGQLTWSDELYRIYGVSKGTFRPTVESFLNLIHPDDKTLMREWIASCEAGNAPEKLEFRIVRPDGAIRSVVGHGELQCSNDGSVCTVSGTAQDITERKEIENTLLEKRHLLEQLNQNLEERVLAAVSELRKKDQMLIHQSRQAALGEMIGNIAHQWRQPLNTIALVVQELEMTYGRPEFSREYLAAHVRKAMVLINHMSKTIDNFISYFKPDRLRTKFNINKAITEAVAMIEPSFTSSDIRLVVNEKDVLEMDGFGKEFSQVVLNIILNARDAYKSAEPAQGKTVELTIFREGDKAVVTIADHAGGIPPEILNSIFDPYFTTKGPDQGTGIGLYMSKMIIEQHMGGRLTVRNVDGGAEFRIEFEEQGGDH